MAAVFRPTTCDPTALAAAEVWDNGERIPQALIYTEDLPRGFPAERFAPQLVSGSYAIRVDLEVLPGKLLLCGRCQRGQPSVPMQPLGYSVFTKDGLPITLPVYEPRHGLVEILGRLYPLLNQKTPGW